MSSPTRPWTWFSTVGWRSVGGAGSVGERRLRGATGTGASTTSPRTFRRTAGQWRGARGETAAALARKAPRILVVDDDSVLFYLDRMRPGMNGVEVLQRILALHAALPVII